MNEAFQCAGGGGGCALVEKSKYANFLGVHVDLGLIGYATILGATIWKGDNARLAAFGLALFGFTVSLVLRYLELWEIHRLPVVLGQRGADDRVVGGQFCRLIGYLRNRRSGAGNLICRRGRARSRLLVASPPMATKIAAEEKRTPRDKRRQAEQAAQSADKRQNLAKILGIAAFWSWSAWSWRSSRSARRRRRRAEGIGRHRQAAGRNPAERHHARRSKQQSDAVRVR